MLSQQRSCVSGEDPRKPDLLENRLLVFATLLSRSKESRFAASMHWGPGGMAWGLAGGGGAIGLVRKVNPLLFLPIPAPPLEPGLGSLGPASL